LPDGSNSFTTKIINVPTAGIISDVNVTINATHPNLQNLTMVMSRPSGTLLTYFNQQCATNANMNVTFDSQAAPFACASPTVGTYALPNTSTLNSLNGFSQMGNWTFGFKDNVVGNAGTVNSIGLEICTQTLAIDNFEFENFALFPNPNKGSFTVQFDSNSSRKINITVFDLSGRKIYDHQFDNTNLFVENIVLDQAQKGIYLVNVADGDKKIVKRVVIE
jgi:subtilisin-like proprotein convertase family protein